MNIRDIGSGWVLRRDRFGLATGVDGGGVEELEAILLARVRSSCPITMSSPFSILGMGGPNIDSGSKAGSEISSCPFGSFPSSMSSCGSWSPAVTAASDSWCCILRGQRRPSLLFCTSYTNKYRLNRNFVHIARRSLATAFMCESLARAEARSTSREARLLTPRASSNRGNRCYDHCVHTGW